MILCSTASNLHEYKGRRQRRKPLNKKSVLKRSARPAFPVIRQPFRAVQPGTIPLQTSPFLKEYILRSHPKPQRPARDQDRKGASRHPPAP